jgi:hypothetical protein
MGRQSEGTHRVAECAATADPRSDGLEGCQRCVEFLSARFRGRSRRLVGQQRVPIETRGGVGLRGDD